MKFLLPATVLTLGLAVAFAVAFPPRSQAQDVSEAVPLESAEAPMAGLVILDAADVELEQFLWEQRIVAVLADSPNDPAFQRQMREIAELPQDLVTRDVIVIVDTDRRSDSPLRLRLRPRGFMLAIIGKDGEIKQRRPAPRSVREISANIDRFPLRRQEMLERMPSGR
ncbi:DUF4174 domain-containing protein [Rhodobacter sp. NTK016B]|uniref:DUF4174 domain-containing protein n=1 Tax=Rhodobacter sp. NTK016B TaxID=2759676 RepID=UPI001A8F2F21|nr:DUF4174 domain-containing protein [Rhodobacter sp. NTK016B]MBN8290773.1 DUF4174 domain-containing protein [Rhodobacter sp. NTK016B]